MANVAKFHKVSKEQFSKDITNWAKSCGWEANEQAVIFALHDLQLPTRATKRSAGYDFFAPFEIHFNPGEEVTIYTGIKIEIGEAAMDNICDLVLQLAPRSSLSNNYGMELCNTIGIVDADYYNNGENEGHIMARVKFEKEYTLRKGERFMQGLIIPVFRTDDDNVTEERNGGFGSTGKL